MQSGTYDILINQGKSFTIGLTVKDDAGNPFDLSGYGIRSKIKETYGLTGVLAQFSGVVTLAASGQILLSMTPAETAALPVTEGVYDVECFNGDETDIFKALGGYVVIQPEVS
jgi:hypothetical protein